MQNNIDLKTFEKTKDKTAHKDFAIFAMFLNIVDAKAAIAALKKNGYAAEDITLLSPERSGTRDFVYQQSTEIKMGVLIGAIVGFFLLGIAGIFVGASDPFELGLSSWIVASVVGAVTGLVVGAAAGALVGIGTPKPAAKRYGFYLKEGGVVVMMHLRNEEDQNDAHNVLINAGGQDVTILEESQVWSTIIPEKKKLIFH